MPHTPPKLLYLLLLLLLAVLHLVVSIETNQITFREAPQFYNSPHCPPPLPRGPSLVCSSTVAVHIAMTLDANYLRGSLAAIHSILRHSSCPQSIFFHFLTSNATNSFSLSSTISSSFPSLPFALYPFIDASRVSGLISTSIRGALDVPLNYARSYLPKIIPHCVPRIVYLDSDIIVVDDIHSLFTIAIPDSVALAAPEYCNANFTSYFTPSFWANSALSMAFAGRRACYFNTGVMIMELERWRQEGYTERIEEWMELQKRMRIYELGSLPPFLLVFAGTITAVEHKWNQHGLGGDNYKGLCRDLHPGPVSLLHWSGKGKPWVRLDSGRPCPLDALWAPYDLMIQNPVVIEDS